MTPEQEARVDIDKLLEKAGWRIFNAAEANIHAARGVAIREFPLKSGHGFADYLLNTPGMVVGEARVAAAGSAVVNCDFVPNCVPVMASRPIDFPMISNFCNKQGWGGSLRPAPITFALEI